MSVRTVRQLTVVSVHIIPPYDTSILEYKYIGRRNMINRYYRVDYHPTYGTYGMYHMYPYSTLYKVLT